MGTRTLAVHEPKQLAFLVQARNALAKAKTVDEVRHIRDKAEALRVYLKQRDYGLDAQNNAAELKIRAERRMGGLLEEMDINSGGRPRKNQLHHATSSSSPKLKDLGIEKTQSHRWQKLAGVPEATFETFITETIAAEKELTTHGAMTLAKVHHNGKRNSETVEAATTTKDIQSLIDAGKLFATIYADPPWKYGNQATRASTDNHYPTMTVEEIAALPIGQLAAERSHLWLWTTNGFLFECPKLFAAWGFEFKSSYIWVKNQIGIGNYLRNSHEFLLLATRGGLVGAARDVKSWGQFDRSAHSAKPEIIRSSVIERISPGPRLELFGRKLVDGWTVWGNQVSRTMFDPEETE